MDNATKNVVFSSLVEITLNSITRPRAKEPSQAFHLCSRLFTNNSDPFVVHLALDEASRYMFFRVTNNQPFIISANKRFKEDRMDVVAEEIAFLALLEDICVRKTPKWVIHIECPMIYRPRVNEFLRSNLIDTFPSNNVHQHAEEYKTFDLIFQLIKRRQTSVVEKPIESVRKVLQFYHQSPQLLIWAKPMDVFFENYGIRTDALKNLAPSNLPRRPRSTYGSSKRVHQYSGYDIQITPSAHHPVGPPVYHFASSQAQPKRVLTHFRRRHNFHHYLYRLLPG
ncbi:hypothetical protein TYRP_022709 [Tyrophagus putrescentiae]|nr:hypothetical protein TYRP_022709 [Tyrophagus putrescentiae]